jgi:hypothetical protein
MTSAPPSPLRLRRALPLCCALGAVACTLRVGSGPGDTSSASADGGLGESGAFGDGGPTSSVDGAGDAGPPSTCARNGAEVKIATGASTDSFAVVWDTDHYVIVYSDPSQGEGDIYSILVNPDGSVRGPAVAVDPTPAASVLPMLIATSTGYLVAWEEGTAGQAVFVHALDKNGQPTGSGVTVASTSALEARPALSVAPGGFVITWMDNVLGTPAVEVAMLDASLRVMGSQRIDTGADGASFPWVAGDGQGAALAWSDQRGQESDIRFADINSAMALQNEGPLRSGVAGAAVLPRMIRATGVGYLAAWEDMRASDNQIFMALTDPSGAQIANGLVEEPDSGDANWPNMAWMGSDAAVVFYQFRDSSPQIFLSLINASGKRVDAHDLQVSSGPAGSWARFPDVQFTGSELGVVWVDTRDGQPELYFARVACASGPLASAADGG